MQTEATIQLRPKPKSKSTTKSKPIVLSEPVILSERQERLWARKEYYKLAEEGFFNGQRVELIEGRILVRAAMSALHRRGVTKADRILQRIFTKGFHVSTQCPLSIEDISDPEPDVAVVEGSEDDYLETHPTTAVLIVEIADSSLDYDRTEKASLYAKANVPDYWIVNLKDRRSEVRRRPRKDDTQAFGYGYAELTIYIGKDSVSPLAKPKAKISVASLLPRKIS
jgi:Uma2 family endonuclease